MRHIQAPELVPGSPNQPVFVPKDVVQPTFRGRGVTVSRSDHSDVISRKNGLRISAASLVIRIDTLVPVVPYIIGRRCYITPYASYSLLQAAFICSAESRKADQG